MAFLGGEGWGSRRNNEDLYADKYLTIVGTVNTQIPGRLNTTAYFQSGTITTTDVSAGSSTIIVATSCRSTNQNTHTFIRLLDPTTQGTMCRLSQTAGTDVNTVKYGLYLSNGAELVTVNNVPIEGDFWHVVIFQVVLATDTSGSVELRIDDQTDTTLTNSNSGIITSTTGTSLGHIEMNANTTGGNLGTTVWCDSAGTSYNTLDDFPRGVVSVEAYPEGNGTNTDWTAAGAATTNYEGVDDGENTINDDTDYVTTADNGDTDSYDCTATGFLTSSDTVIALEFSGAFRQEGATTQDLNFVTVNASNTTTTLTGTHTSTSTGFVNFTEWAALNPDTGAAWTVTELDANEYGFETTA